MAVALTPPFVRARAQRTRPVDGKPAWFGKYQVEPGGTWQVARSGYGSILYTSPEYARAGAIYCAMRDLDWNRRAALS